MIRRPLPLAAAVALCATAAGLSPFAVLAAPAAAVKRGVTATAAAATPPGSLSPEAARTVADTLITPAQLKDYLSFIASDQLQGRDTPSNGLNTAALFLATDLHRWGFRPAGDADTYFQKIALRRIRPDTARVALTLGGTSLRYEDDFVLTSGRMRGADAETPDSAPLVYVSHGWSLPRKGVDPYQGVDVRGKILVVNGRGLPEGYRYNELLGPAFADAKSPQQYGAAHGAVGILYLPESTADYADARGEALAGRGDIQPEENLTAYGPRPGVGAAALPSAILSPDAARRLFAGEPLGPEQALANSESGALSPAFDFGSAKRGHLAAHYVTDAVMTQNVVAVWEGSDPALKDEYVALGAHYDHLGMAATPDANGDTIYNGADDDGSGTTGLLAMAEAFSHSPVRPKRSILFVWHCGEEKGLWGSSYFTSHPTVPLNEVAAQLNIDMIGRSRPADDADPRDANLSGPHTVYVIGSKMLSTELGELSERVNRGYQNLTFDYRYDDPKDPERFFYRSDHFNYARHGIPIIFYFDGVHRDYHQRSDEVSKIDFTKMTAIARTVFLTAVNIADLPHMPVVDKTPPGVAKKARS